MTASETPHRLTVPLLLVAFAAISSGGCAAFHLPPLSLVTAEPPAAEVSSAQPVSLSPSPTTPSSDSERIYYAVREAHAQGGVVLQVQGDSEVVRVMPLPPGGHSVFVSTLLEQTGAQRKLGSIEATLFRHSPEAIGGLPLKVKMSSDGRTVRSESDYALHAGDRLRVRKAVSPLMKGLFSAILGR